MDDPYLEDYFQAGIEFDNLLYLLITIVLLGVPIARILRRIGFSRWWTILAFFPLLNLILLWTLAFSAWPVEEKKERITPHL